MARRPAESPRRDGMRGLGGGGRGLAMEPKGSVGPKTESAAFKGSFVDKGLFQRGRVLLA